MDSRQRRAIPERLGRYEIIQRLSAGGMGEVFLARYAGSGGFLKPVALKRVHPHLTGEPSFVKMLHDEANMASAVSHPNIVATIDVGAEGGDHFVVLDYVSGDSLVKLRREMKTRDERMPRWMVAWIGAQIASALHAVHEARSLTGEPLEIVHRDVSCANIMLSDGGHPMLFDFGIAKAKQRQAENTMTGEIKGKLIYMAPETFRGVKPTRSVDVFGLGVVMYELLTNVSPYQRENDLETLMALQNDDVPPPTEVLGIGDPELDRIVMRAMARDREDRYPTAEALERALREWATKTGAPQDAIAVAEWFSAQFPERIEARKALLARLGEPFPVAPLSEDTGASLPSFGPRSDTPIPTAHTIATRNRRRGYAAMSLGLLVGVASAALLFLHGRTNAEPAPASSASPIATESIATTPAPPPPPIDLSPTSHSVDFSALPDVSNAPAASATAVANQARARPPRPPSPSPNPGRTPEASKKGPLVRTYDP